MTEEGVMGKIAATSLKAYAMWVVAVLPSIVFILGIVLLLGPPRGRILGWKKKLALAAFQRALN